MEHAFPDVHHVLLVDAKAIIVGPPAAAEGASGSNLFLLFLNARGKGIPEPK